MVNTVLTILVMVMAAAAICLAYMFKNMREEKKSIDALYEFNSKFAVSLSDMVDRWAKLEKGYETCEEAFVRLRKDFSELSNVIDELPIDDIKASNELEKRWNESVESIVSYGANIPKLNKEAIRHE